MRIVCVAALLAALCAAQGNRIQASEDHTFAVSVHLNFDRSITPRLMKSLQEETEGIWRPYGVQIEWNGDDKPETVVNAFPLEAIVERQIAGLSLSDETTILGRAVVQLGAPAAQPIRVSFDATEHLLALRTPRSSLGRSEREGELARALGRVLAHEIGHVLLAAPNHDREGLMRAAFRPNELAAPKVRRSICRATVPAPEKLHSMTGDDLFAVDRAPCIPR